jgi:diguanylate cyclase (GGDEF)-like protein
VAAEVAVLRSINARLLREVALLRQREAQALRLADRDGLTGLYNRRRMPELLDNAIAEAVRHGHKVGILFVDLDGFKRINDGLGHAMGDKLLVSVAARISTRARSGDVVCRYGGDEFVVLLPRVRDRAAALKVAASLRSRVAAPHRIDGEEFRITAAVGVSIFPDDGVSSARLLERADARMYRDKAVPDLGETTGTALEPPTRRRDDKSKRRAGITEP